MYNKYISYINIDKEDKEVKFLYRTLSELHEAHPDKEQFSVEEYTAFSLSKTTGSNNEVIASLLASLSKVDVGQEVLSDLVIEAQKRAIALESALVAIDVSEGRKDFQDLLTKVKEYETIDVVDEETKFVSDDLEELYEHNVAQQGLRWRLQALNQMLGSLRKGDFGFVFARPESGKTTFLASEVSYFAGQADAPILWFNNEEQGEKVSIRVYQAALGLPLDQLYAKKQENKERYYALTGRRIKIFDSGNIYKRDVETLVKKHNPSLVIFDQIDKIKGFNADREDLRLGSIYIWARELAKEFCPVIGVCQADGSGEGKQWLTMENVSNAKTSKQAEADWILGIGKENNDGAEYVRYLHLSKNKLTGDSDTIASLRHGKKSVIILPDIARYKDP